MQGGLGQRPPTQPLALCPAWQLELIGHSVFDYVHPCDQEELQDALTPRQSECPSTPPLGLASTAPLPPQGPDCVRCVGWGGGCEGTHGLAWWEGALTQESCSSPSPSLGTPVWC